MPVNCIKWGFFGNGFWWTEVILAEFWWGVELKLNFSSYSDLVFVEFILQILACVAEIIGGIYLTVLSGRNYSDKMVMKLPVASYGVSALASQVRH